MKSIHIRVYIVFFSILFLTFCETNKNSFISNSSSNTQVTLISYKKTEDRKLYIDLHKDNENKIYYLTKTYSKTDYNNKKATEISNFKNTLKKSYPLDFIFKSTKYFNIACQSNENTLNSLQLYLIPFFEQIYPKYFLYEPVNEFYVVYFQNLSLYSKYTNVDSNYGHYSPSVKTIYTYINSGYGTLWHEMIHAFIDANSDAELQEWFTEGFASFYEMASLNDGQIIEGYTNWRLPVLKTAVKENKFAHLSTFLIDKEIKEDFGKSEARFLFCYLWVNKVMSQFVKTYLYDLCINYKEKELGQKSIETLEKLLVKDIETINQEIKKMVLNVKTNEKLYQDKTYW